jgi:hypothetical protein
MRDKTVLQADWELVSDRITSGRIYYTFDSKEYGDTVQVTISVSTMFRNPEDEAWRLLDITVA